MSNTYYIISDVLVGVADFPFFTLYTHHSAKGYTLSHNTSFYKDFAESVPIAVNQTLRKRSSRVTSDCNTCRSGDSTTPFGVTIVRCTDFFVPVTATKTSFHLNRAESYQKNIDSARIKF